MLLLLKQTLPMLDVLQKTHPSVPVGFCTKKYKTNKTIDFFQCDVDSYFWRRCVPLRAICFCLILQNNIYTCLTACARRCNTRRRRAKCTRFPRLRSKMRTRIPKEMKRNILSFDIRVHKRLRKLNLRWRAHRACAASGRHTAGSGD